MRRSIRSTAVAVTAAGLLFGLSACAEAEKAVDDTKKSVEQDVEKAKDDVQKDVEKAKDDLEKEAIDAVDKTVNQEYEVTYEVTGENIDTIEYVSGGGTASTPKTTTVKNPALPWKKTVKLRGIIPPQVTPIAADITGAKLTCKIVYQGKAIAEQNAKGLVGLGACTAVSPIV
ncbi:MmpS family transport accessory protein [Streptomyces sp. NPDC000594]|uniref:MmpS family transport accessory protein n=1 Tax=Streptomyces sp. NPDC000594 TaxID=3154261 RepID=UPI0033299B9C